MFGLSAAVRVDLAKQPADMRKSFDGLAALASGSLALDPLSGHLLVFGNVTIVPDLVLSITPSPPHLELILSKGRRIAVTPGFDPQTLRCLIAVVEDRPCLD
jgi:IS66 Orf2 like protein